MFCHSISHNSLIFLDEKERGIVGWEKKNQALITKIPTEKIEIGKTR